MADRRDVNHMYKCRDCDKVIKGGAAFRHHIRALNHPRPVQCPNCNNTYHHLTSLTRHVINDHLNDNDNSDDEIDVDNPVDQAQAAEQDEPIQQENVIHANEAAPEDRHPAAHDVGEEEAANNEGEDINLVKTAASITLTLRGCSGITSAAIQRSQEACFKMAQDVNALATQKVKQFLNDNQINTPASEQLLKDLTIEDPFSRMRTIKQQLRFFNKEHGLVLPETKFLDYRIEYFLNSDTGIYEPVQVPMTFENISVIKTLTQILSDPKLRRLIESEKPSEDGVLRSYLDGSRCTESDLFRQFPYIIRIQFYWDDLEVVNPLGSKTTIHKLAAFYFSIQNLPGVENSQLSAVHLVALAHSEDIKKAGFEKVLTPLISEMKKLERQNGVKISLDQQPSQLNATLCSLCADGLAAHDILGLLAPGATHFCRLCMISRDQFHANMNAVGIRRTKAMMDAQVAEVRENPLLSTEYGIRRSCPLSVLKTFCPAKDSVFDIFHVLLEGVVQWVLVLSIRSFVSRKLLTLDDLNGRIQAFNYGVTDIKNKPCANLNLKALKTYLKLKQTGSQVWCLLRAIGFLVPEVPDDDPHLLLLNLLQEICLIVFAEEVRPEDIDRMDTLIETHHILYEQLYLQHLRAGQADEQEGEESDEQEDEQQAEQQAEEDVDDVLGFEEMHDPEIGVRAEPAAEPAAPAADPAPRPGRRRKGMTPGNKLHEMKHFAEQFREHGPLFKYWCARYEGRHHIFVKYGSVCGNFINPPKTMAQMHQLSTLGGMLKTTLRSEDVETQSTDEVPCQNCVHGDLLARMGIEPTAIVSITNTARVSGDIYRKGLFVLLDARTPAFGIIQSIYIHQNEVFLIVCPWETESFVKRYCAHKVKPLPDPALVIIRQKDLLSHRSFPPWSPWKIRETYIPPRTIIF